MYRNSGIVSKVNALFFDIFVLLIFMSPINKIKVFFIIIKYTRHLQDSSCLNLNWNDPMEKRCHPEERNVVE